MMGKTKNNRAYFMNIKKIVKHLNFIREAKELGVPWWESPSLLFLTIGILTIVVMIATYFSAKTYDDPTLIVGAVSIVTVFILTIGTVIVSSVERIAEASRMKSEFIAIASHELKTPLSAIKWALDLILSYKKEQCNEEILEYLVAMNENNERLIKLTNNLLDVSRIESGSFTLNPKKQSIVELIEDLVKELQPLASVSNVSLTFSQPQEQIPLIYFDSDRIKMVLVNLIHNAIKYIKGKGNVNLSITRSGNKVVVEVRDTGVGIPRHDQPFIFSKFYRSNNTFMYQTQGAGLGLFIARAFIEASGGKIGFKSSEGSGSVFWFSLPIK